jgi:hypothetical protein
MVDAGDLKSPVFGRVGSIPTPGTNCFLGNRARQPPHRDESLATLLSWRLENVREMGITRRVLGGQHGAHVGLPFEPKYSEVPHAEGLTA